MEKQWGRAEILGKYVPYRFESRRGDGEEGEVKKVKTNLVG